MSKNNEYNFKQKCIIIGLMGDKGAGKTTVAKHLERKFGFKRISFMEPLKKMLNKAGLCSHEELWEKPTEKSLLMIKKIGNAIFEKQVKPHFWVEELEKRIEEYCSLNEKALIVVEDVDRSDVADAIQNMGGVLILIKKSATDEPNLVSASKLTYKLLQKNAKKDDVYVFCDFFVSAKERCIERLKKNVDSLLISNEFSEAVDRKIILAEDKKNNRQFTSIFKKYKEFQTLNNIFTLLARKYCTMLYGDIDFFSVISFDYDSIVVSFKVDGDLAVNKYTIQVTDMVKQFENKLFIDFKKKIQAEEKKEE